MDNPTVSTSDGSNETIGDLKTRLANLLINRVSLSETLNVVRDACVQRAAELIDQADSTQLENIKKDIELFENPPQQEEEQPHGGVQGPQGVQEPQGAGQEPEITAVNDSSGPLSGVQGLQS